MRCEWEAVTVGSSVLHNEATGVLQGRLKDAPFSSGISKKDLARVAAQQTDAVDVSAGTVLTREGTSAGSPS